MKILASGDHHFDEHSPRWPECQRIHDWIVAEVFRRKPDLFLSGGDIYERASTPAERAAVAEWLTAIAEVCPVIIARGNHDKPRDCELLSRLRSKHPITVEERAGVHVVGDAAIAVVAWPNRASIAAMMTEPMPAEALDDVARDCLRAVMQGLHAEITALMKPSILLTHAMISGAVTSVGQPLIGGEMNVSLDDLALVGADIVIAGHIHCPQDWTHEGMPVVYCGSPFRTAYGETEQKSIVEITLGEGHVRWERIATPATPMLLIEGQWNADTATLDLASMPDEGLFCGAEIRLRYDVASDQRDAAKRAASELRERMKTCGAASVKVEERVIATVRARMPEISSAKTLADKMRLLWEARGTVPDSARAERLIGKLAELDNV